MLSSEITHFLAYCKLSGFSDKSLETLTLRLREFNTFLTDTDIEKPADLTYDTLRVFINASGKQSLHIKKAKIWGLRQFCHFCVLNGYMNENIALGFPYPKIEKKVPKYLTIEEYNQLIAYFYAKAVDEKGLRDLLIILLFGLLGVRLASIIALNTDDVDLVSGAIRVVEKGGKERNLILPKILCRTIGQYLSFRGTNPEPMFLSRRGKRLSESAVRKIFKVASVDLGIDKTIHAHLFRHTAATHLNKVAGTTITQHVLGHAWRQNTYKYTHLNPDIYAVYMTRHPYMQAGGAS